MKQKWDERKALPEFQVLFVKKLDFRPSKI